MTYRIQGLGWLPDPPDFRDYHAKDEAVISTVESNVQAMLQQGEAPGKQAPKGIRGVDLSKKKPLPKSTDLRSGCSEIEDQGNLGSCTAQAVSGLIEYLQRSLYGEYIDAARLFLYKVTRSYLGWTGDTGAFVRSTIKALRLFGVPPEDYCPYDTARFDDEPGSFLYAFAGNYKAIQYYRLDGLEELRTSLANGIPFAFGFTCYRSMFTDEVRKTGAVPLPAQTDDVVGGHAVMAVGYDDATRRLLFRNSWGTGWGEAGYGSLPYEFVERDLAQDFWSLVRMDVVPLGQDK